MLEEVCGSEKVENETLRDPAAGLGRAMAGGQAEDEVDNFLIGEADERGGDTDSSSLRCSWS
jgi:hypothetical protein